MIEAAVCRRSLAEDVSPRGSQWTQSLHIHEASPPSVAGAAPLSREASRSVKATRSARASIASTRPWPVQMVDTVPSGVTSRTWTRGRGENEVPTADKFARLITGSSATSEAPVPDFYAGYAERFGKPLAIVETAAFYRPGGGGASESEIKAAWLAQVFSAETRARFPLLRLVNWF